MKWLSTGAKWLSEAAGAVKDDAIRARIDSLLEDTPKIRISSEVQGSIGSWLKLGGAYDVLLTNIDRGVYTADKELLVNDCLAILDALYADREFMSFEKETKGGKKKTRTRERGEVVEDLTTLLLDNWKYVSDAKKRDMELFLSYAVYMVNKVDERTHEPASMGGAPITMLYPMRIMILLDCIARLERLNETRKIRVAKPQYSTYGDDEIAFIRSKLKPPKSDWQRGEYNWKK